MNVLNKLLEAKNTNRISESVYNSFLQLYQTYAQAVMSAGLDVQKCENIFDVYLKLVKEQSANPYPFEPFHTRITSPFNYYEFGLDFMRPLFDKEKSKVFHLENVEKMKRQLNANE